jgi:hypothetical protein
VTSKAGYWIGGGLLVCAVAGAILWGVAAFSRIISTIDDFQHVAIPASEVVRLEARKYVIYIEGPGADQSPPPVRIRVADDRTEQPVAVRDYGASVTYSFNTSGSALATVTPPRAGAYRVRTEGVDGSSGYRLAIGETIGGKIVSAVVGAFAVGAILGIAGIGLLIATGVRRSRRRRQPPPAPGGLPGLGV